MAYLVDGRGNLAVREQVSNKLAVEVGDSNVLGETCVCSFASKPP